MSNDIQKSPDVEPIMEKDPESVPNSPPAPQPPQSFTKDFVTGCLSIIIVSLILFVAVPILLFIVKLSAALVIPLAFLVILVILTASIGRIINVIRVRWSRTQQKN